MLTYKLQQRRLKIAEGKRLTFPNRVVVELTLDPQGIISGIPTPSRMILKDSDFSIIWDANTGSTYVNPKGVVEALDVALVFDDGRLELKGNVIRLETHCDNIDSLAGGIDSLYYALIPLLNLNFPDPPAVKHVTGRCGDTEFGWEHMEVRVGFTITDMEHIEQQVMESFQQLGLFQGTANRRLIAALHYCFVASRLLVAGQSPWEFMPECVLNMTKSLEILFGSNDEIRKQLALLDYSEEEIEGDFIPITLLRAQFDVAHPRLAVPRSEQLPILYRYLVNSETRLRVLLRRILIRIANGTYQIRAAEEISFDDKEQKKFDRLIESMKSRIDERPSEHDIT